jgi:predicted Zn-dependent protease
MAGAYDDPRLEALINKTVERLVAASERPDQAYKVTILNSGAVNAFALPTGQLYVTRGLIALASDTSELSSVLSHEMAHVLAKHAAMREDQARQAAGGDAGRHRHEQRPRSHGAGAGQDQADDGELLAAAGASRPTASASGSPRARISIPMARRAS